MRKEVIAKEQGGLRTDEIEGYLWRPELYQKVTGKAVDPSKLISIRHKGVDVKGILRDEEHPKAIKVVSYGDAFVTKR